MLSLGRTRFHKSKFQGNRVTVRRQVVFGNQFRGNGRFGHRNTYFKLKSFLRRLLFLSSRDFFKTKIFFPTSVCFLISSLATKPSKSNSRSCFPFLCQRRRLQRTQAGNSSPVISSRLCHAESHGQLPKLQLARRLNCHRNFPTATCLRRNGNVRMFSGKYRGVAGWKT